MPATAERLRKSIKVQMLRKKGYPYTEIASQLGISRSYVHQLVSDPDGSKARDRKNLYRGECEICGSKTSGSKGRALAPTRCRQHVVRENYWGKDGIIEAIQKWNSMYGRPPKANDWVAQDGEWPANNTVQAHFGSWANGIEAAGFARPRAGYYQDESSRGQTPRIKWTKELLIAALKEESRDGYAPNSAKVPKLYQAAKHLYGDWYAAIQAASLKLTPHSESALKAVSRGRPKVKANNA